MKTVLNIVHYPVFGGPHNRIMRLAAPLAERGWYSLAVLPDEPGDAAPRLRAAGIHVGQIRLGRLRASGDWRTQLAYATGFIPDVLRLHALMRRVRPDLVVIGGLVNSQAAFAGKLAGVPVVWQVVDSRIPPLAARLLMRVVERLADVVMFNGEALRHLHCGERNLAVPSFVYYPPVDTQRFIPSEQRRRETREEWGVPEEAPLVGMVANINPAKGIEYFVRAAGLMYRECPEAWFAIVGPFYKNHEAYTARIREEIRGSGLPDGRIMLIGPRADVECVYPAFDLHLITSLPRSEGSTTTALEAMACGVPIVAVDVGAVREAVLDGVTGTIVPALEPERIARAALSLLGDRERLGEMSRTARARAVEVFDVERSADIHRTAFERALISARQHASCNASVTVTQAPVPPDRRKLRDLLVCPACHGGLAWARSTVECAACWLRFPVEHGIPVLLLDTTAASHDEIDHDHHRREQAAFYDRAEAQEFEIERPRTATRLYGAMLSAKLRRGVRGVEKLLPGATVANVCGGSGMDAEMLARRGARVLLFDTSIGAAARARERAGRYGLCILPVVADATRLPLRNHSVAIAFVHDGLHHLPEPVRGLREMARVAACAVSVSEPASAALTSLAIRFRLALEHEAAGNRVARLRLGPVTRELDRAGFQTVRAERYAMFYRHHPGRLSGWLSGTLLLHPAVVSWQAVNRLFGRYGNKLVVVAVRRPVVSRSVLPAEGGAAVSTAMQR